MAETPVAGDRKTTGKRRKRPSAAPDRDIRTVGMGYINTPTAQLIDRGVPNIRVPEQPSIAQKFSSLSTRLQRMQERGYDKAKTNAQLSAQALIESEQAKGKSLKQIREDFIAGKYPQLKSQLQEDMFSNMYGGVIANDYFNSPMGQGYKDLEEWNKKFLAAPYEERQNMNFEQFLAEQKTNFRERHGATNNIQILAGASRRTSIWSEEQRKKHAEHRERRLDEDKITAGVSELRSHLSDMSKIYRDEADEDGVEYKVEDERSFESIQELVGPRVEAKVEEIAERLKLDPPEKKRLKMTFAQNLVDNAWQHSTNTDVKKDLQTALSLLQYKPPGAAPSLMYDYSTFSVKGGTAGEPGSRTVAAHAAQLSKSALRAIANIDEGMSVDAVVDHMKRKLNEGDTSDFNSQSTANYGGTKKSRDEILKLAIDSKLSDLNQVMENGKRLSLVDKYTRMIEFINQLPEGQISSGLNYFKNQVSSLNNIYLKISAASKQKGVGVIDEDDVNNFRKNFTLYKALQKWSPNQLDKVFPPDSKSRHVMEFFNIDRLHGQSAGEDGERRVAVEELALKEGAEYRGSGLTESILMSYKHTYQDDGAYTRVARKDVDEVFKAIDGDVANERTGIVNWLFDRDESDLNPYQVGAVKMRIRQFIKYKMQFGIRDASVLKEEVKKAFQNSLVAVEVHADVRDGTNATFFVPPNSPFRDPTTKQSAANYVKEKLDDYAKAIGYNVRELSFQPLMGPGDETNRYIIVDRLSGRPIILDNPSLSMGKSIFDVNHLTVKDHAKTVIPKQKKVEKAQAKLRSERKIGIRANAERVQELVDQGYSRSQALRMTKKEMNKLKEEAGKVSE